MKTGNITTGVLVVSVVLGIVVCAWLLQQLLDLTLIKEGFATKSAVDEVEPEERMSPEVFSYNLVQAVKGPILRLGKQLIDMNVWKERMELAKLSPVELARRNMMKPN